MQMHGVTWFTPCSLGTWITWCHVPGEHDAALTKPGNTVYFCTSCDARWINYDRIIQIVIWQLFFFDDEDFVDLVSAWSVQREHSALLSKLEFICDLVHCVVSVAEERSSPLAQSIIVDNNSSPRHSDNIYADELQRCIEQLVLYVRALHLLSSGLQLAQCAIKNGHLERSKTASRSKFECCVPFIIHLGAVHKGRPQKFGDF